MKRLTKAKQRNCAKCGSSPADDPSVKLHRFPQPTKVNKPRCELWAKFCFPKNAWKSPKFQSKLYREHKMLCDKHFKSTSIEKEKLRRSSRLEKDYDMIQENFTDVEIVEIKNEPDEDITNIDHGFEVTRPQQRTKTNIATSNSPNKTNSPTSKEAAEESAGIHDSLKTTTKDMWDVELPEMSQEDFDETYNKWFSQTSKSDRNDDCQLYGKLITKKLRTYSVHERNLLMYKIDGLLIENPPGFDTSSESISTKPSNQLAAVIKKPNKAKQSPKKVDSSTSILEESNSTNSDKSSSKLKRKRVKKVSLPPEDQMNTINEEEPHTISTQVTSTSMPCFSPVNIPIDIPPPAATSSISKQQPVKVTHIPNEPVKVTSSPAKGKISIQYQPIKVTSSIPNQPVKVTNSIPNKPAKITTILNQPVLQPLPTSVPSHLPLQITIPETKFVPVTQSKVSHPKGKIVIMKSKSSKYVPSSQPPILITVPSLSTVGHFPISTQCDMDSLEQLSSIAVTCASQAHHTSLDNEEIEMADDMDVVSHEVILSASSNSPS